MPNKLILALFVLAACVSVATAAELHVATDGNAPTTRKPMWTLSTGGFTGGKLQVSPLAADANRVYFLNSTGGSCDAVAASAKTGKVLWRTKVNIWNPLNIPSFSKKYVAFSAHGGQTAALLDARSGKLIWERDFGPGYATYISSNPYMTKEGVLISTTNTNTSLNNVSGLLRMLSLTDGSDVWTSPSGYRDFIESGRIGHTNTHAFTIRNDSMTFNLYATNLTSGKLDSKVKTGHNGLKDIYAFWPGIVVASLSADAGNGKMVGYNMTDGTALWTLPYAVSGSIFTSVITPAANNNNYFYFIANAHSTWNSNLVVKKVGVKTGEVVWTSPKFNPSNPDPNAIVNPLEGTDLGTTFVFSNGTNVIGLDSINGQKIKWTAPFYGAANWYKFVHVPFYNYAVGPYSADGKTGMIAAFRA